MKIKEVSAGVKISKNYDSYQAGLVAELEIGENPEKVGADLMEKALGIVSEKMELNNNANFKEEVQEIEVGAAWISKDSKEKLSVQYSKGGSWVDIDVSSLEKTKEGYKQAINEEVFIFKKIPEGKRRNNKMPVFRIYKGEGKWKIK